MRVMDVSKSMELQGISYFYALSSLLLLTTSRLLFAQRVERFEKKTTRPCCCPKPVLGHNKLSFFDFSSLIKVLALVKNLGLLDSGGHFRTFAEEGVQNTLI